MGIAWLKAWHWAAFFPQSSHSLHSRPNISPDRVCDPTEVDQLGMPSISGGARSWVAGGKEVGAWGEARQRGEHLAGLVVVTVHG